MQLSLALSMTRQDFRYRVVTRYNYYDPNVKYLDYDEGIFKHEFGLYPFYEDNAPFVFLVRVGGSEVGTSPHWLGEENKRRTNNSLQKQGRIIKELRGMEAPALLRLMDNRCRISQRGGTRERVWARGFS